jgi:hypothetical protein
MRKFTEADIQIIDDAVAVLRKRPDTYIGDLPWGPRLAAGMALDLVLLGALPMRADRRDDWWLVESDVDWLNTSSGPRTDKDPFKFIVPLHQYGQYAFRSEILLSAFADVVVTGSGGQLDWITGGTEADVSRLPKVWADRFAKDHKGRFVAFMVAANTTI